MDIIRRIDAAALEHPDRPAQVSGGEALSYGELSTRSELLAGRLDGLLADDPGPVAVHGHKQPGMLVAFLSVVKSGRAYIPIDDSWPADRIGQVLAESGARLLIAVSPLPQQVDLAATRVLSLEGLAGLAAVGRPRPVTGPQPFYVIYTSGSTGRPKGVQISAAALGNFVEWALGLTGAGPEGMSERSSGGSSGGLTECSTEGLPEVWLNQAPFSFDLSVMDTYCALASGATLFSLSAETVAQCARLQAGLADSGVVHWVSTPSFAAYCLADPGFNAALLPRLRTFLFCGEVLPNSTVQQLHERFPGCRVVNTYGPTESTVAVTSVLVDEELLKIHPLPVGRVRPGSRILIRRPDGTPAANGQVGEILIAGDTLSLGYLNRPELDAFIGQGAERCYCTGDLGWLDRTGLLHFVGRRDHQVKLHGYRIELDDVEANLRRVPGIRQAAVLAVCNDDGQVSHLRAFVSFEQQPTGTPLGVAGAVKKGLRALVPDYMVPKVITTVEEIPLTANGKVDRRALLAGRP